MKRSRSHRALAAPALALFALALGAQEQPTPAAEPAVSFHDDVRPLLLARCQGCHQPAKDSGDVVLMTHADLLAEVDGLPLVVPGDPQGSLLVEVVSPLGAVPPSMPEDGDPLTDAERALLVAWIEAGAPDDTPPNVGVLPSPEHPPVYPVPPIVTALAFSPDGDWLAVSGRHEVLLHPLPPLATPADAASIDAATATATADAVPTDAATADAATDAATGPPRRLIGLSPRIESIAFAPTAPGAAGDALLAVAGGTPGRAGELQLWRPADGTLLRSISVTYDTLRGVSWSPDGALVAVGGADRTLRAFDAATGAQVLFQGAHEDWVLDTTFSLDGSHLISVGRDRSAKLTKVATEQFIDNITSITPGAMQGGLLSVERHPTLDQVLVGGVDGEPKLYKIYREKRREIGDDFNRLLALEPFVGTVTDVGFAPDGATLYACASLSRLAEPSRGGALRAYAADGTVRWTRTFDGALYALAVHPTRGLVATAGFDGDVHLLDAATGTTLLRVPSVPLGDTAAPKAPGPAGEPTASPLPADVPEASAPPAPDSTSDVVLRPERAR